jgi:hypothetical protein
MVARAVQIGCIVVFIFLHNDKHIYGDVQATNVTEATTPLDDAPCCASSFWSWCKRVWNDPFLPIRDTLIGWAIGATIGVLIIKFLLQ